MFNIVMSVKAMKAMTRITDNVLILGSIVADIQ